MGPDDKRKYGPTSERKKSRRDFYYTQQNIIQFGADLMQLHSID